MARIGGIEIFNETEEKTSSVTATSNPVEQGEPFTDHVQRDAEEYTITGYILSDDWRTIESQLETAMYAGRMMKYVGRFSASNVIILDIRMKQSEMIANGADLTLSLRKIRVTKTAYRKVKRKKDIPNRKKTTKSGKKKQTGKRNSAGVWLRIKKNDTYWMYSRKYGTSIPQLRAWNHYKDRFLPIGGKIRVK